MGILCHFIKVKVLGTPIDSRNELKDHKWAHSAEPAAWDKHRPIVHGRVDILGALKLEACLARSMALPSTVGLLLVSTCNLNLPSPLNLLFLVPSIAPWILGLFCCPFSYLPLPVHAKRDLESTSRTMILFLCSLLLPCYRCCDWFSHQVYCLLHILSHIILPPLKRFVHKFEGWEIAPFSNAPSPNLEVQKSPSCIHCSS